MYSEFGRFVRQFGGSSKRCNVIVIVVRVLLSIFIFQLVSRIFLYIHLYSGADVMFCY